MPSTVAGASTYTNDADGNTLTGAGRTNTWDSQNRLASCTTGNTVSSYTYGADGLRRRAFTAQPGQPIKRGPATQGLTELDTALDVGTSYAYDGTMLVREGHAQSANGTSSLQPSTVTATYLIGARGPEYRRDDTATEVDSQGRTVTKARWYVYDGLGSVVGEVDPLGNLTSSPKYDVYGAVRSNSGTASSRQGFVGGLGHVSDTETGLVYMRARYYDPSLGRFASQDGRKNGNNWFIYAQNSPTCSVDRTGNQEQTTNGPSPDEWTAGWIVGIAIGAFDKLMDVYADVAPEAKCALGEMLYDVGSAMMGAGRKLFGQGCMSITIGTIMDASNQFGDLECMGQMAKGAMQGVGGIAEFAAGLAIQEMGEFLYYA